MAHLHQSVSFVALISACYLALASGKHLAFTNCGSAAAKAAFTVSKVVQSPDNPDIPGAVTVTVEGTALRDIAAGDFEVKVVTKILWFDKTVRHVREKICDAVAEATTCPITAGDAAFKYTMKIPLFAPKHKYHVYITAKEDTGGELACINTSVDLSNKKVRFTQAT
ncbi:hypothetical protein BSKO_04986 [Bryopsis sp. KO-2023]|nr:hypothetical protein BSKO_04986 [Bryopsis sp. KO-2023]